MQVTLSFSSLTLRWSRDVLVERELRVLPRLTVSFYKTCTRGASSSGEESKPPRARKLGRSSSTTPPSHPSPPFVSSSCPSLDVYRSFLSPVSFSFLKRRAADRTGYMSEDLSQYGPVYLDICSGENMQFVQLVGLLSQESDLLNCKWGSRVADHRAKATHDQCSKPFCCTGMKRSTNCYSRDCAHTQPTFLNCVRDSAGNVLSRVLRDGTIMCVYKCCHFRLTALHIVAREARQFWTWTRQCSEPPHTYLHSGLSTFQHKKTGRLICEPRMMVLIC